MISEHPVQLRTQRPPNLSIVPPVNERPKAFVARQAILDRAGNTWAYQLLYRDGPVPNARYSDPQSATATVLLNALMDMGLQSIVDDKIVFLSLTGQMLVDNYWELLPRHRVVVEIPADTVADASTRSALAAIQGLGNSVALAHYRPDCSAELLRFCDYAKVDVSVTGNDTLEQALGSLRRGRARPIAHKVGTARQYDTCRNLGFSHFQGFYLSDPRVLDRRRPPTSAERLIELLRVVNDPAGKLADIERVIRGDVTLMYRLLRYLNSARFGFPRQVSSVRQAIVLVGLENIKRWASVLALASAGGKPVELLRIALIRARMCKNLTYYSGGDPETFFMAGLFSVLDALLDRPITEILSSIPLASEISDAILERRGRAGEALDCVIAYEQGNWKGAELRGCGPAEIASAWFRAVEWTDPLIPSLS
jgi:c-di-GMP phosphodiesterase